MARPKLIPLCEEILGSVETLCRRSEGHEAVKDQTLFTVATIDRHLREASFRPAKREAVWELKAAEKGCRDAEEWLSLLSRSAVFPAEEADRLGILLKRLRRAIASSIREREERLLQKEERIELSIQTPRLLLKPFDGRHDVSLPGLFPEEEKEGLGLSCSCREEAVALIRKWQERGEMLAVIRKSDETLIGLVGLKQELPNPKARRVLLGIKPDLRLRGYGTEALRAVLDHGFGRLGMETVCAFTSEGDAASRKLLRNCGFTESGVLPHASENGENIIIRSLSKDEWITD